MISLTELIEVLITLAIIIVIAGISYFAVCEVYQEIKEDTQKRKWYFPAYIEGVGIYIDITNPITLHEASARIASSLNIYTFNGDNARIAEKNSGFGVEDSSEIDKDMKKGYIYYYHWNVKNRILPSHAWYGRPYTL